MKVSYETLSHVSPAGLGHGGLCRVKGQYRAIIDKRATPQERVATLAAALAQVATAEQRAALPERVREALDNHAPRVTRRAS